MLISGVCVFRAHHFRESLNVVPFLMAGFVFNNHIFKMEQEEYMREKIDWSQVSFKDNKDIIDLIDNPQKSIFSLLDSQGFIKNTNDRKLKDTIYANLIENKSLVLNKKRPDSLIIKHYAGEVEYNITGFIEKNDDQLNNDIVEAFEISKNKLIKYLFKKVVVETKKEKEKVGPNKLQSDSLSKQFKKQLDELVRHHVLIPCATFADIVWMLKTESID